MDKIDEFLNRVIAGEDTKPSDIEVPNVNELTEIIDKYKLMWNELKEYNNEEIINIMEEIEKKYNI